MKKLLMFAFCISGVLSIAQEEKQGTIKLKKTEKEPIANPEVMPVYRGGYSAMYSFISSNVNYPKVAIDSGYAGTTYVQFTIGTDGQIYDVKTLRGIPGCPECDQEAVRVVRLMQPFTPGMNANQAVAVLYTLPIKFRLK
jgi:protein TonB